MFIYPAIDLLDDKVVRLQKGDFDQVTVYELDPLETARSFKTSGAERMHMVDLNGARSGIGRNYAVIERVASLGLFLEVGGGIREEETIQRYLDAGVSRCILGTVAVRDPAFVERMADKYGDGIAVGVDAKDGRVSVSGWEETTDLDGISFCKKMRALGVRTIIYTDISRDGMLEGANIPLYEELQKIGGMNFIASGGVSTEKDIWKLASLGLHGAIIGKALYEKRLDLASCIQLAREVGK